MSELIGRKLRSSVIGGIMKNKMKKSLETKRVAEEVKIEEPIETFKSKFDQETLREVQLQKDMIKKRLRN